MLATSLTNAYELFFAAKQASKRHGNSKDGISIDAELVKVAVDLERITLPSGLSFIADQELNEDVFDMVYLPAYWRNPRPNIKNSPELIEWVRYQFEHGAIINSTGTGVCIVAEAGILDNKPATTHWYYFDQFAKDYPLVQLKRQHFITSAGRIYCAASVNALTDLTLHHVHRFYGSEIANHLSRHFSHEVRKSFDVLNFNAEENSNHPDEEILQAQLWMQNNLSKTSLSIAEVAKLFSMSPRTFTRRFKSASNLTPLQYLQKQRIDTAKELLQSSNLSIKEIAYRVGYIDVSYFTKLFKKTQTMTPKQYRDTVRAKLFSSKIK